MARPTSRELHRAKRKKEQKYRDIILLSVDESLSQALAYIDAVIAARKQGVSLQRSGRMLDNAARRVHACSLILRDHLYDDPTP